MFLSIAARCRMNKFQAWCDRNDLNLVAVLLRRRRSIRAELTLHAEAPSHVRKPVYHRTRGRSDRASKYVSVSMRVRLFWASSLRVIGADTAYVFTKVLPEGDLRLNLSRNRIDHRVSYRPFIAVRGCCLYGFPQRLAVCISPHIH